MNVVASKVHGQTPVFMAHGHYDQAIDFNGVQSQMNRLKADGLNISFHEYDMAHEIDIHEIRDLSRWLNDLL